MVVKSAIITDIRDHQISFLSQNNKFMEMTTADSTLNYIEIFTFGSVVRGIVVNTLTIVITAVFIVDDLLSGRNPTGNDLPWDNGHKRIKVRNLKGVQKWNVEVVAK